MSLADNGEYFQHKQPADVPYFPVVLAQTQHKTESSSQLSPLAPKVGWDALDLEQSPAMPCCALSFPSSTSDLLCHLEQSLRLNVSPFISAGSYTGASLTSLTNEPNWSHRSVDETHFASWSASISPLACSSLSSMIRGLFLIFATTAGVQGYWTELRAWKTEVLQMKHKVRWGLGGNYSLLFEISAFLKEGTDSSWSICGLLFSPLLQSLWAILDEWGLNHTKTGKKYPGLGK